MRADLYGSESDKVNRGLDEIYLLSGILRAKNKFNDGSKSG